MKILFLQQKPCSRNFKQAYALKKQGHSISLGYIKDNSKIQLRIRDNIFDEIRQLPLRNGRLTELIIKELAQGCDVCHVHNEPDRLTKIAIRTIGHLMPVVHDTHDLRSLRGKTADRIGTSHYEKYAHTRSNGLLFCSQYQLEQGRRLYDNYSVPAMVLWTAINEDDIPDHKLTKLSASTGGVHIVYEGGCKTKSYRDHRKLFSALAEGGFHIHIHSAFPAKEYERLADKYPTMHYYDPLPPKELFHIMTRYDAGLIPLNIDDSTRECGQACMPNKLFEYIAAGLPIISRRLEALERFITERQCGMLYDSADDILNAPVGFRSFKVPDPITMEDQIPSLIAFYEEVLND